MNLLKRKAQLKGLLAFLKECESQIIQALNEDLGRPVFESSAVEIGSLRMELKHTLKNLDAWVRPQSIHTPLTHEPGQSWISYEPLGNILVIAPWNYPFLLTLSPWINAVAAGNWVTLKPSELAPASSRLLAQQLPCYVEVEIHEGGPEVTQNLLSKRFDHIVFTGSARIGRLVAQKAAEFLTPVTLELGGKSPCIVDHDTQLEIAAKRIAWGKFMNAGQTCVAPDYLLVHESIHAPLIASLKQTLVQFFGSNPRSSPDYGRIINTSHTQRLAALLSGGQVVYGGEYDLQQRYFSPTLIANPDINHALMRDEIFGPILPILSYSTLEEALEFVKKRPKPLAFYYFSNSRKNQERVLQESSSGGVCLNDTISHLGIPDLPFGGVGDSGFGAYHGRAGFERFSHAKAVYRRSPLIDVPLRYPPYTKTGLKIANWLQS